MDTTHLGRTGLKVSRICLGTMNFGPKTSEEDSFAIMDRALDEGINFFDTADVYGWAKGEGLTERIVGRWFAQGGGRRDKVVLATKVYGDMGDWPNESRLSALSIRRACEASLKRLQTDYIDLYQMHHIYREAPWEEIWQAYETLVQQGKVLYAGSSNFAGWHIVKANEAAKNRHFLGLVSEQSKYSLVSRAIETDVIPACIDYGVGVIPWSPLEGGLLSGPPKEGEGGRRTEGWYAEARAKHGDKLERWEALCAEMGEEPSDVAIAWMLHQPGITAPIVGPRTMAQLEGGVKAEGIELDADALAKIDAIFPPRKPAPEDYAW